MGAEFIRRLRAMSRLDVIWDYNLVRTIEMEIDVNKDGILTYCPTKFADDDGSSEVVIFRCAFEGVIFECSNFDLGWEIVEDNGLEIDYWDEACALVREKTWWHMPRENAIVISEVVDPDIEERRIRQKLDTLPYFGYYKDEYDEWHGVRCGEVVPENALTPAQTAAELVKIFEYDDWQITVGIA